MAAGALIAESLKLNAPLELLPLAVRKVTRLGPLDSDSCAAQGVDIIEFSVPDEHAPDLAEALEGVLDEELGWYCDFRTEHETFVVLPILEGRSSGPRVGFRARLGSRRTRITDRLARVAPNDAPRGCQG